MPKVGRTHGVDPQQSQLNYLLPMNILGSGDAVERKKTPLRMGLVNGKPELIPEAQKVSPRQAPPTPVKNKPHIRREFNVHNINTYPEDMYRNIVTNRVDSRGFRPASRPQSRSMNTPLSLRNRDFSPHKVLPPIEPERSLLVRLNHACSGAYLPLTPMQYTPEEQLTLKRLIQEQFTDFTLDKCQNIYMELTGFDKNVTGYVTFTDLDFTLVHNQIEVNKNISRLVASQFVGVGDDRKKVNYEDFLSYIRGALIEKQNSSAPILPDSGVYLPANAQREGVYRNPINNTIEDKSRFHYDDLDTAKLQQMVRQELEGADDMCETEQIHAEFTQADRAGRGTLSREQIHSITAKCQIPLQASLIDKVIDRKCRQHSGQYDWREYLDFIGKVIPDKTGLTLSHNKKPLEYARELPEPSSNWPHGGGYGAREATPRRQQNGPAEYIKRTDYRDGSLSKADSQYDAELQKIEENYARDRARLQRQKQQATYTDEPWFKRFIRMTDMLYAWDTHNTGVLPYITARQKVSLGNDIHQLGLTDSTIDTALRRSLVDNDHVIIDKLVDNLSMDDQL